MLCDADSASHVSVTGEDFLAIDFAKLIWRKAPRVTPIANNTCSVSGGREAVTWRGDHSCKHFSFSNVVVDDLSVSFAGEVEGFPQTQVPFPGIHPQPPGMLGDTATAREEICKILALQTTGKGISMARPDMKSARRRSQV